MQVAIERSTGRSLVAYLIDGFHERYVRRSIRDGTSRFGCPGCGADVVAKGGGPDRLDADGRIVSKAKVPHFAHWNAPECQVARAAAGESAEHRELKRYVADSITRRGWLASVEYSGDGLRSDVLAAGPCGFDAVIGTQQTTGRAVAFEVQHTPEAPSETLRRTNLYRDAGREVVWLFDHDSATQVGRDPAVVVQRRAPMAPVVTRGIWRPRGGQASEIDLDEFVGGVLDREIVLKPAPTFDAPLRCAWVWTRDLAALHRESRTIAISAARAEATARVEEVLAEHGITSSIRRRDDRAYAYATIVRTALGDIAVHPRPSGTVSLAKLEWLAVVVASKEHVSKLGVAGVDPDVVVTVDELGEKILVGQRWAGRRRQGAGVVESASDLESDPSRNLSAPVRSPAVASSDTFKLDASPAVEPQRGRRTRRRSWAKLRSWLWLRRSP